MSKYDVRFDQAKTVVIGDNPTVFVVENASPNPPSTAGNSSIPRADLLTALNTSNAELRAYPHEIAGLHLDRPEVDEICRWIVDANTGSFGMVVDQPGSGKTVIMRSVLVRLSEANVPVLAIKADSLSGIKNASDLATRLNLPLSVKDLATTLAKDGSFAVLMDQVDALSMNLSRDQPTLDVMLNTLAVLRDIENVKVISSCRTFDLNHDPRLSGITPDKKFPLLPLTDQQVTSVLESLSIDPGRLLPSHRSLLTNPLHLSLYAQLVANHDGSNVPESFSTLQELYEALWQKQIANTPPAAPAATECTAAIYALVDAVQNNSQLTAPLGVLDTHAEAARYLQQINFIRRERNNYLFAHQTLFDYCYARRFVAASRSVSREILAGPQGLFERSQLVQILAYLRGTDRRPKKGKTHMSDMTERELKALQIAAKAKLQRSGDRWFVPSQTKGKGGDYYYTVKPDPIHPHCTCPDFESRKLRCKHIFAVEYTIEREQTSDGQTVVTETLRISQKTYSQDWPSYNKAQTHEKEHFQKLLHELCKGIGEPSQTIGRPRMPLDDMIFSAAFKVYSTVSARRFMCDLRDARAKGYISRVPAYNTIFKYFENDLLTPHLQINRRECVTIANC